MKASRRPVSSAERSVCVANAPRPRETNTCPHVHTKYIKRKLLTDFLNGVGCLREGILDRTDWRCTEYNALQTTRRVLTSGLSREGRWWQLPQAWDSGVQSEAEVLLVGSWMSNLFDIWVAVPVHMLSMDLLRLSFSPSH